MATDLKHTRDTLNAFAKAVIKASRQNLTKGKKNVTKDLYDSMDYNLNVSPNSFELKFFMETYGIFQDRGVDGVQKKHRLVGRVPGLSEEFRKRFSYKPNSKVLQMEAATGTFRKWLKAKNIRLRDSSGRYVSYKQGGFMVAQMIKRRGIKPSLFFTKPFSRLFQRLPKDLVEAYGLDIRDFLEFTINDILNDK